MRIAVVTGASAGMGRETVIQLADRFQGIDEIWVLARRKERLIQLQEEVPVTLRCFGVDLTNIQELESFRQALIKEKPQVKFLVNAAGFGKIGNIGSMELTWETDMVALNCQALCAVTHMVLPFLADNSRIIQYASSAAFLPQPGFAIYAATKAFVLSYSKALHEELRGRDICVTAVCPGPVSTEFFDVAETTGKMPIYKMFFTAKCKNVVKKALRDSIMKKTVSIYGWSMKGFSILCKVLPHSVILKIMAALNH